jgi:acyl-ACP thioesterase
MQLPLSSTLHERLTFKVPAHACNARKQLRIPDLIRELQETALYSTLRLGVSVLDLEPKGLGWVLLGQYIKLFRTPRLNETCTIVTCPVGFERVFTYRDFHILDEQGAHIGVASTTWMLMDLKSRRMAPLPDFIKVLAEQVPPPEEQLPRAGYKLASPDTEIDTRTFQVGHHQLDFNGHLTNPVYVEWMLEGLEPEIFAERELKELSVQFKQEARFGETVSVQITKGHGDTYHHGLSMGGQPLASMQTTWE